MILVPGPDGAGSVELLQKEQAADFVGKGHLRKREPVACLAQHGMVQAKVAADEKSYLRPALFLPAGEQSGQFF